MLISPLAVILVLVSLVFPCLEVKLVHLLGGPAPQSLPTDQSVTAHSSLQDQLDAVKKKMSGDTFNTHEFFAKLAAQQQSEWGGRSEPSDTVALNEIRQRTIAQVPNQFKKRIEELKLKLTGDSKEDESILDEIRTLKSALASISGDRKSVV